MLCPIIGIIAVMLLLVKCYDKKGVVTLQLGHLSFDLASGGYPTKKNINPLATFHRTYASQKSYEQFVIKL